MALYTSAVLVALLHQTAQESPDAFEEPAEQPADACKEAADGTHETTYHAHLRIT